MIINIKANFLREMLNNKKEKLETSTSVVAKGEWNPQTPPPQSLVQEINAKITKQTAGTENSWTLTKKKNNNNITNY